MLLWNWELGSLLSFSQLIIHHPPHLAASETFLIECAEITSFYVPVVLSGEEPNTGAVPDAPVGEETQWDWTTQDKTSPPPPPVPSTSSCPQPQFFNWVYTAAHTLFLPFPLFLPICTHPFSSYACHAPIPSGPAQVSISTSQEFYHIFDDSFCKPVPFKVQVLLLPFYFAWLALLYCIVCCQVHLPVFVTHMYKSLFKPNTLLFIFFSVCVFMNIILSMLLSVSFEIFQFANWGK